MKKRTNFYYSVKPNQSGSVFCGTGTRRETDDLYHCAHEPQCNLFVDHECKCNMYPAARVYTRFDRANHQRYRNHLAKESSGNPYSKVTHDPILMYIIYSKYTKNTDHVLFVADKSYEVLDEVKEMNRRYGHDYWTFESYEEYNSKLLALEKEYKIELSKVNASR